MRVSKSSHPLLSSSSLFAPGHHDHGSHPTRRSVPSHPMCTGSPLWDRPLVSAWSSLCRWAGSRRISAQVSRNTASQCRSDQTDQFSFPDSELLDLSNVKTRLTGIGDKPCFVLILWGWSGQRKGSGRPTRPTWQRCVGYDLCACRVGCSLGQWWVV